MLQDVEDILDSWESTGLLEDYPDRFNLALILETQRRVNESTDGPTQFLRVSIPVILNACKQRADLFQGLIDFKECNDVYRLGVLPRGEDADVALELVQRLLQLGEKCLYFGGVVAKNGYVYLIADTLE